MKIETSGAADWWRLRSPRERGLLLIMLALLAGVAGWYGLIQPLRNGAQASALARAAAVARLERAQTLEAGIQAVEAKAGAPRGASQFEAAVNESAQRHGVVLDRRQMEGGTLNVWVDAADPKQFVGWLARLQAESGVAVANFTAIPGEGGRMQMQAGLVD